jgi:hypothetical protein
MQIFVLRHVHALTHLRLCYVTRKRHRFPHADLIGLRRPNTKTNKKSLGSRADTFSHL